MSAECRALLTSAERFDPAATWTRCSMRSSTFASTRPRRSSRGSSGCALTRIRSLTPQRLLSTNPDSAIRASERRPSRLGPGPAQSPAAVSGDRSRSRSAVGWVGGATG
jgi:hypothetical protein